VFQTREMGSRQGGRGGNKGRKAERTSTWGFPRPTDAEAKVRSKRKVEKKKKLRKGFPPPEKKVK